MLASSAPDRVRARQIVRLAAGMAKSSRAWLLADERGTWETTALEYLEKAASMPQAASMTAEAIDKEIASVLVQIALEALLRDAQREPATGTKRKRRR